MNDIFKPKVELFCTIEQAVEFIAFGWEPLNEEYEAILDEPRQRCCFESDAKTDIEKNYITEYKKAEAKLKLLLKAGLKFRATVYNKIRDFDQSKIYSSDGIYDLTESYVKSLASPYKIEIDENCGVTTIDVWENGSFLVTFGDVEILFTDIKEILSPENQEDIATTLSAPVTNGYTTPLLTLIQTMIEKGYVSQDNQPLAKNLQEDIKKEAEAANIPISKRIVESMTTILRLPETQKGGCKKMKE